MKNSLKKFAEMILLIGLVIYIPSSYGCREVLGCSSDSANYTVYYWNNTNEEVHMVVDDEKLEQSNKVYAGSVRGEKYFLDGCFAHQFKVGKNGDIFYTAPGRDNVYLGLLGGEVNVYWDGSTLNIVAK
jgi:hypothetical protein